MTLPSNVIDIIATQILLDTKGVLESLKNLDTKVETSATRIAMIAKSLQAMANSAGVSIDTMAQKLQRLNAAGGGKFGSLGISNQDISRATDIAKGVQSIGTAATAVKKPITDVGDTIEKVSKKSKYSIDVIRTAMGVLTAMLVNVVITAFINLGKAAINGLREIETATYNLIGAERVLSEMGVGITPKELQDIIDKLLVIDPLLSKIQAMELVSRVSRNVATQLGFSKTEIEQLSQSIAVLAIRNKGLGKSFEEVESQVTNAFLTGKVSVSINSLGIKITDQIVKDEALRIGLVKTADEFENLTGKALAQVKALAMLSVIKTDTDKDLAHLPDFFKTADASFTIFQSRLQDLLTTLGKDLGPLLIQVFVDLADRLSDINDWLIKNQSNIDQFVAHAAGLAAAIKVLSDIQLSKDIFSPLESAKKVADAYAEAYNLAKDGVAELGDAADTAAGELDNLSETTPPDPEAFAKLQEELQQVAKDAADAYDELRILTQQKYDKIELDLKLKLEDIDTEFAQKLEDIERDLQQKLQDIAIETQQKIDDIKTQAREDEMRAELEFQQRMKELRQQFLMDLDDALHARDARQVLRLIKQYELDKKQALDKKKLDDKLRAEKLAADIKAARLEEQRKIQEANREAARKQEEAAIERQRDIDAANLKYKQEMDALVQWNKDEMAEITRHALKKQTALIDAYNLEWETHVQYQTEIAKLISDFAAMNMATMANMYAYMASLYAGISSMYAGAQSMIGGLSYVAPSNPSQSIYGGFAEGGSVIVDKPTMAIFGEGGGREMATFTPLNKTGRDSNKLFGGAAMGGTTGGRMLIEMLLSPDLEARVIENSLSRTADIVARISRSK